MKANEGEDRKERMVEEDKKEWGEAKRQRPDGLERHKLPRREQRKLHSQVSVTRTPWNGGGSLQQSRQSPEPMGSLARAGEMLSGSTWNGAGQRRRSVQLRGRRCLAGRSCAPTTSRVRK